MARKEGAIKKIVKYLEEHVGEPIPTQKLNEVAYPTSGWSRTLRLERQVKGLDYTYDPSTKCYTLNSLDRKEVTPIDERYINAKVSAMVKIRDNSTCRMCGRKAPNVIIHIDHIIPFDWGGPTTMENLQCLCERCNEGKKSWVASEDPILMEEISKATSTNERLRLYFEYYPNVEIEVDKLATIAHTREWTRQLRKIRELYDMDIKPLPNKKGVRDTYCYIYLKDNK